MSSIWLVEFLLSSNRFFQLAILRSLLISFSQLCALKYALLMICPIGLVSLSINMCCIMSMELPAAELFRQNNVDKSCNKVVFIPFNEDRLKLEFVRRWIFLFERNFSVLFYVVNCIAIEKQRNADDALRCNVCVSSENSK